MNKVVFGDCRESMQTLARSGVTAQMCVTSPPYFGLRDYGHEGQIGLEPTPEEYVANLVEVFSCVKDLLTDDGVLWLNIGDSYNAAGRRGHGNRQGHKQSTNRASANGADNCRPSVSSLKPKDIIGIPWRVAFALQSDGWYLRQDIIWSKPNPMPESVLDRTTKSHEYVFLLAKSERYYFDADSIKESSITDAVIDLPPITTDTRKTKIKHRSKVKGGQTLQANPDGRRNKRSVWTIPTQPYKGAHFAVFPEALVEPCVLAGSRQGDVVLDPFFGSGTTGRVAQRLGRKWIGCEINCEYEHLQHERTAQGAFVI